MALVNFLEKISLFETVNVTATLGKQMSFYMTHEDNAVRYQK